MALQWLDPAQTEGKVAPYLFSQCQQIHARTMVPCQDTPLARIAYKAEVTVPEGLTAVMSAGPTGDEALGMAAHVFRFAMPQPIPSYLLALAVGRLEARDLSPRARVWAEPETVAAAAWEFAGVEDMILKAEGLFGPYPWDRYDMLVLPPSFPYGGMENPRMTFLTPTLLAGDRSLVDVVAHELAHSWTGNLVTNASMEHFWLNEGFTVWAERRILRILHGDDAAAWAGPWARRPWRTAWSASRTSRSSRCCACTWRASTPTTPSPASPTKRARGWWRPGARGGRGALSSASSATTWTPSASPPSPPSSSAPSWMPSCRAPWLAVNARAYLDQPGMPATAPEFRSASWTRSRCWRRAGWMAGAPAPKQIASWKPTELLVFLQKLPRS
jgi:leukotriene-A4 hydrolase